MDNRFGTFLQYGQFGSGRLLEQGLLWGQFWTRRRGCYLLFGGEGAAANIDYDRIVGTSSVKGVFAAPRFSPREAGTNYYYAIRRVSETGKSERNTSAVVCLSLDANGRRREARPNAIVGLRGRQIAERRVELIWRYNPLGQEVCCERFLIYPDHGNGAVDYSEAAAEVRSSGGIHYRCELETESAGCYRFGMCAVSPSNQKGDLSEISIEIRGGYPKPPDGVTIQSGL